MQRTRRVVVTGIFLGAVLHRTVLVTAELSGGAASMAALLQGRVRPAPGEKVCAIVCGAGRDGIG